jgi:hypothetical protein
MLEQLHDAPGFRASGYFHWPLQRFHALNDIITAITASTAKNEGKRHERDAERTLWRWQLFVVNDVLPP